MRNAMKPNCKVACFLLITAFFFVSCGEATKRVSTSDKDSLQGKTVKKVKKEPEGKSGGGGIVQKGEDKKEEEQEFVLMVGTYRVKVSGFAGKLVLKEENGVYTGTISFKGWGNGKPQPLKELSVKKKKIYFVRSVTSEKEKEEYGSPRFFKQVYYGKFTNGGTSIKGYYTDSGAENRWEAMRK